MPNTPKLLKLWLDGVNARQKCILARNPSLSVHIQKVLARDQESIVRDSLTLNSSLTPDVQKILAMDSDWTIRLRLTFNPSLTKEAKKLLGR